MNRTESKSKPSSHGSNKKDKTAAPDQKRAVGKKKDEVTQVKEEPVEVMVGKVQSKSTKVLKGPKARPSKFTSAAAHPAAEAATAPVESKGARKQVKRKLNEVVVVEESRKKARTVEKGTSICATAAVYPADEGAPAAAGPHTASGDPLPVHEQISATKINQSMERALQNVQDIDELLKSQKTERTDCQLGLAAPAMISEGAPWKLYRHPETPGSLYIFGKVKTPPPGDGFSSCCVILKNINRRVVLLPREKKSDGTPVDFMDVYNEFQATICPKYGITCFKAEKVTTKYGFNIQVVPQDQEAEYVEISYSDTLRGLPDNLKGKTFSHAFKTNQSLVAAFLNDKKLKGPSWLRTVCWQQVKPDQQHSRCEFEFTCDGSSLEIHPNNSTFSTPHLILASINLQSINDRSLNGSRIVFAGIAVNRNFHLESPLPPNGIFEDYFGLLAKPPGQNWRLADEHARNERILEMESEQKLIERLIEKFKGLDADVFLAEEHGFDNLQRRIWDLKINNWSWIGRLHLQKPLGSEGVDFQYVPDICTRFPGRFILEMSSIYDGTHACLDGSFGYSLSLRMPSQEHAPNRIIGHERILSQSPQGFSALVKSGLYACVRDIQTINELELIPLAFQINSIVGASLYESLFGAAHAWSSWSSLDVFYARGCTELDIPSGDTMEDEEYMDDSWWHERGAQNALTSEGGFCENFVLRLAFERESIQRSVLLQEFMVEEEIDGDGNGPRCTMREEVRKLVECWEGVRRTVMSNNLTRVEMQQKNIELKALAWVLDAMFKRSPLNDSTDLDKAKSHAVILKLGGTLGALGLDLILGFEDWVVVNTKSQDYSTVVKINRKVVDEISKTHPLLEVSSYFSAIDCFSLFNMMGTKKWLSLSECTKDVVPFVADMAHECFHEIMCDQSHSDVRRNVGNILRKEVAKLRDGTVELEKLLLTKNLAKDPKEYEKAAQEELEDHVRVALRMNKYGKLPEKFRKGDQIPYLVGMNGQLYHSSEIITGLKFDEEFYWVQIVQPVVSKILDKIGGYDGDKLADELGLGLSTSNGQG